MQKRKALVKRKDARTKRFIARGGRHGALDDFFAVLEKIVKRTS